MSWEVALGTKSKSPWKVALQAARHQPKYTDESVAKLVAEVDAKAERRGRQREAIDSAEGVWYNMDMKYTDKTLEEKHGKNRPDPTKAYELHELRSAYAKSTSGTTKHRKYHDDIFKAARILPIGEEITLYNGPEREPKKFLVTMKKVNKK